MGTIGRKIYREVVIDMQTGETLYEDSYIYEGPMMLCDEAPDPPPDDPPPADDTPPADDSPPPDDDTPPADEPSPSPPPTTLKYKSHEEAEEGYKNLEKKLGEQGNQVSEYKKQVEFLQRVAKGEINIDGTPKSAKADAAPPPGDGKPIEPLSKDFYDADGGFDYEKHDAARLRYAVDLAKWEWTQDTKAKQQQTTQAETLRKGIEAHEARIKKAAESDPAILDIVADTTLPISNAMYAGIVVSEDGPSILRYLHEHRDEAKRIFELKPAYLRADGTRFEPQTGNPFTVFYELGRIAGIVKSTPEQKPKIRSNAPPPHVPVGGNNGKAAPTGELASLAKSDPAEYLKRVHAGEE